MNDILTNGTEIKKRIISEISNSRICVNLAMAWFTDRDIANTIIAAKNKGVTVDIILSSNAQNETVKHMFKEANINVHAFETGDERGMMHHKFCLIDNKLTINGSYNYSYNASNNNVENIHLSDDLATYKQFLAEFDKLKYNIDNNIPVYITTQTPKILEINQSADPIESFAQQLHNLVYLSAEINTNEYKVKGFEKSNESFGSVAIFTAEYNNIKEQIGLYAVDETLGSKKSILISNINIAFESKKGNLEVDKKNETNILTNSNDLEKKHIVDRISDFKQEKTIIESGNANTGVNGLIQINKQIEILKLDKRSLEESFIIKPFATIGTIAVVIFLVICLFYLSIFFASALYKVFFEGNLIRASLEAGISPHLPQLVDANAIIKIFKQQGTLFGIISSLVFLFPLALTNMKILGSKKNWVNVICFWVGLLIFDILVSAMVALNTDTIKALLKGEQSTMQFWEVIKQGEFYLIFVFGMLPLFITHYLVDYVTGAYQNSRRDIVDAEKARKIYLLEGEMIDLETQKDILIRKIVEIDESVKQLNDKKISLEVDMNTQLNQIESKYVDLNKNIKMIFDEYNAKITTGKIFTDVVLISIISAYKTGFIEYLPKFYSAEQVANRVKEIEFAIVNN